MRLNMFVHFTSYIYVVCVTSAITIKIPLPCVYAIITHSKQENYWPVSVASTGRSMCGESYNLAQCAQTISLHNCL